MTDYRPPDDEDSVKETVEIAAVNRNAVDALLEDRKVILDSKGYGLGIRIEIDQSVIDKFEQVATFYKSTTEAELEKFYAYLVSCTYDLLELFSINGFSSDVDNPHRIKIFFGGSTTGELDKKIFTERTITDIVLMRAEVENLKPFPLMFKLVRGFYISQQQRTQGSSEEPALPSIHVSNYVLDIIGLLACKAKFFEFEEKGVKRYKQTPKEWSKLKEDLLGNPVRVETGENYTDPMLNYVFRYLDRLKYNEFMGFFRSIISKKPEDLVTLFTSSGKNDDNRKLKTGES